MSTTEELQIAFNNPIVCNELQFVHKDPELITALKRIRQHFIEERGLMQPSFDTDKQLELHGQMGYMLARIFLCDDLILALTLPPVPLTQDTNHSEQ